MRYIYGTARLPCSQGTAAIVDAAAGRLAAALSAVDVDGLDISGYSRSFLRDYCRDFEDRIKRFTYPLCLALSGSAVPMSEFVFVDYGGGTGIMSLLANQAGIGTVIYNDIDDQTCTDAQVIAQSAGCGADHYVTGDIDDLAGFLQGAGLECRAIASSELIEHVYDIELFLRKLPRLSKGPISIIMLTGANPLNPLVRARLMAHQRRVERFDRNETAHRDCDCSRAFLEVRKEIVEALLRERGERLAAEAVDELARRTRGRNAQDIRALAEEYLRTKVMPPEIDHPTNTCDPYTGNWAERLMNPYRLAEVLTEAGCTAQVLAGYWRLGRHPARRVICRLLNRAIPLLGRHALWIAPSYVLFARRDAEAEAVAGTGANERIRR